MTSSTQKSSENNGLNLPLLSIPPSFLLQIGAASVLVLLTAQKTTVQALKSIGEASEELLRRDRLPILPFPVNNTWDTSTRGRETD